MKYERDECGKFASGDEEEKEKEMLNEEAFSALSSSK